jgi:hypothetical protein
MIQQFRREVLPKASTKDPADTVVVENTGITSANTLEGVKEPLEQT